MAIDHSATQCGHPRNDLWQSFRQSLPAGPHDQPVAADALHQAIVRVYARRLHNDLLYEASDYAEECLHDAILDHYNHGCGQPPLQLNSELMCEDGPIVRLLLSAQQLKDTHLKFKTFCFLAGLLDGPAPPSSSWSFFLNVLRCIRQLTDINWRPLLRTWAVGEPPAIVPIQCVMDLLANVYNTHSPAKLKLTKRHIAGLVLEMNQS